MLRYTQSKKGLKGLSNSFNLPSIRLQCSQMSTQPVIPARPPSLVNSTFTEGLQRLYTKKLKSNEIFTDTFSASTASTPLKPVYFKSELQLFNRVIANIQECANYWKLNDYIDQVERDILQFPDSCLSLLLGCKIHDNSRNVNFEALNEIFESMSSKRHVDNDIYHENLMKLYLSILKINRLPLNIIYLNLIWSKHGTKNLYDDYVLTYLINLFNSGQKQLSVNQLLEHLVVYQGGTRSLMEGLPNVFITYMLETRDFDRLHIVLSQFVDFGIRLDDNIWISILLTGLQYNNYEIVNFVYKNYIMKDFLSGKLTLEDAVLNQNTTTDNSVFGTFTDTLILQILHTISMNGDIKSTEDLVKGHFVYKALSSESSAMTKKLCIKIIESYCYSNKNEDIRGNIHGDESIKRILDLINVFLNHTSLSSVDIFDCMNYKFKHWKIDSRELDDDGVGKFNEEGEEIIPIYHGNTNISTSRYGIVLANLSNLNEFISIHADYMNKGNFKPETQTIFINCLLNHMVVFLNHTGMVSVLKNLHFIYGDKFIDYLDATSWDLILQSVSLSTSKKCARFYFEYMKSHNIEITPRIYSRMISASVNGDDYSEDVLFYVKQCLDDHGELNHDMQRVLQKISSRDTRLKELLAKLQEDPNITIATETPTDAPAIERKYLGMYDLRELEILEQIFS